MMVRLILTAMALMVAMATATERITVHCHFEASANGYQSFDSRQNMLLTSRDCCGEFLDADGHNWYKSSASWIQPGGGSYLSLWDGTDWQISSDFGSQSGNYTLDPGKYTVTNVNSGTFTCTWEPGWQQY